MTPDELLQHLRSDADAVLAVLAQAELTEPVGACPGWTLRDLTEHLGSVHRWATEIVRAGEPRPEVEQRGIVDLAGWFAEGAGQLLTTLEAADPSAECWSFTSDRTAGFWVRRQALETVVHRWDAERAIGEPGPVDAALAEVGVSEVVELMTPRQVRLGRIDPLPMAMELRATDTGRSWVLGDGEPLAQVDASAESLFLLLWHRVDPSDPRVYVTGDAGRFLRLALTP